MGCRICVEAVDNEVMPLDFSMLLGTSPPTAFMPLNGYDTFPDSPTEIMAPFPCRRVASFPMVNKHQPPASSLKVRSISETDGLHKLGSKLTLADLKRELSHILEEDEKIRSRSNSRPGTPNGFMKPKKQVAFADDKGYELVTIKVMTEPSDMPPKFSSGLLRRLLGQDALAGEEARPASTWTINFSQPACDYMNFRQSLEKENVGLENVLVKNDVCRLAGTVKVKNVSFEKEVFLRITDNNWTSFMDKPAKYTSGIPGDIFETFSFDFEVPADDDRRHTLEFCVCFKASGLEYWDSNKGNNFQIISEAIKKRGKDVPNSGYRRSRRKQRGDDAFLLDYQNWSEFSVSALNETGPYW